MGAAGGAWSAGQGCGIIRLDGEEQRVDARGALRGDFCSHFREVVSAQLTWPLSGRHLLCWVKERE